MRLLLADIVLLLHFALAAFIVVGLAATWLGAWLHWRWVRNAWFRTVHILAIGVVALEGALGMTCPLTLWEDSLRQDSGGESFVGRWVQQVLYYDFPEWIFTLTYLALAAITAIAWIVVPPRRVRGR
jgi:hypothetical protein